MVFYAGSHPGLRALLTISKADRLFPAKISMDEFFDAFYFHLTYFMALSERQGGGT